MTNKKPINESELDELLRNLYLDKNNPVANEDLAQFVMAQEYEVPINPKKAGSCANKTSIVEVNRTKNKNSCCFICIVLYKRITLYIL